MDEFKVNAPTAAENPPVCMADLTQEEYILLNETFSKISGPMRLRRLSLIVSLVMTVLVVAIMVYEIAVYQFFDIPSLLILILMVVLLVVLNVVVPRQARRMSRQQYDNQIAGGYSYYGAIRLTANTVEKETAMGVASLPLDGRTLFIETPQVMAFFANGKPAIAIPARYLTADTAATLRAAADKLPYRNRRLVGRVVPGNVIPIPVPAPVQITLWEKEIRYKPEESATLMQQVIKLRFMRQLPWSAAMSVLAAIFSGMNMDTRMDIGNVLSLVGTFLLLFGIIILMTFVLPTNRAKKIATLSEGSKNTAIVRLTDRGVWLMTADGNKNVLPWGIIEHIINREPCVEITVKTQVIHIPKRVIDDIDAFDTLIKSHWKKTKSK